VIMAVNSSEAGSLLPTGPQPPYDNALDDLLHATLVGLTGIAGSLVRPRWQPEPPQMPDFNTNWIAFGVVRSSRDAFAYMGHQAAADGSDELQRTEELQVLVSCYGPNAHGFQELISDGLEVTQNRDALTSNNIALVECQEAVVLPALLKEKWVRRVDMTIVLRRKIIRIYPVLNLQQAVLNTLDNEHYTTTIQTP